MTANRLSSKTPTELVDLIEKAESRAAFNRKNGNEAAAQEWERKERTYEQELQARGRCKVCGKPLTNDVSIAAGIGPDCLARQQQGKPPTGTSPL